LINHIHSIIYRPERGWDPVPRDHAERYSRDAWKCLDTNLIEAIGMRLGGFEGKAVLDLGGGPGQYSVAFAERGAYVHWHDISNRYREMLKKRLDGSNLKIKMTLGYLEDIKQTRIYSTYDLVFCRACWNYCIDDLEFSRLIHSLIRPGGIGFIESAITEFAVSHYPRRLLEILYTEFGIKIGHPYPPSGKIAELVQKGSAAWIEITKPQNLFERILFRTSVE
jgi:2-polyprenyl-3-methyl-5-hydroxy-6-metoxy-1,4-benzoquinol methylase